MNLSGRRYSARKDGVEADVRADIQKHFAALYVASQHSPGVGLKTGCPVPGDVRKIERRNILGKTEKNPIVDRFAAVYFYLLLDLRLNKSG